MEHDGANYLYFETQESGFRDYLKKFSKRPGRGEGGRIAARAFFLELFSGQGGMRAGPGKLGIKALDRPEVWL